MINNLQQLLKSLEKSLLNNYESASRKFVGLFQEIFVNQLTNSKRIC